MPSNPPFDDRISRWNVANGPRTRTIFGGFHLPGYSGSSSTFAQNALIKGQLYNTDYTSTADMYIVNFLYNPSVLNLSHAIDANVPDPQSMSKDDQGLIMGPLNQSLNFTLLFDRTYETWDSSYQNDPQHQRGQLGVYVDIKALYDLVGITTSFDLQGAAPTSDKGWRGAVTDKPSGPMRMVPTRAVFGLATGPLSFFGYIADLEVEYTHFTTNMVPNRATVGISMNLMIDSGNWANSSAATSTVSGSGDISTTGKTRVKAR
jgi:hypothetical protein